MRVIRNLLFVSLCAVLPAAALAEDPAGKATFDKTCASCHGADGRGSPAKAKLLKVEPDDLNLGRDAVANQTRDEKRALTASGKGKMPSYEKKLGAPELDAVIDYTMGLIATIRGKK